MFNVKQNDHNPILHPLKNHKWENVSACNGCPIARGQELFMVYRAISNPDIIMAPNLYQSIIGVAKASNNGKYDFTDRQPLIRPEAEWEKYGCEDPRIVEIDGRYLIFYTALSSANLGPDSIKVAVAVTRDLKTIEERHLVTPFNAKAMALWPEKINGKYYALVTVNTDAPPARIGLASFDKIEDLWDHDRWAKWYDELDQHELVLRRSEADLTEVGAPPVKTKDGWLVIYSHIQNYYTGAARVFGVEAALLDLKDPRQIIGRTRWPVIIPDQVYAKFGFVSDVSFPTGAVVKKNQLEIFYGAADTTTCVASLPLDGLLKELSESKRTKVFERWSGNPILTPIAKSSWENKNVFNPTALDLEGTVRILYRAQNDSRASVIGYAESLDGVNISYRHDQPVYGPRADFESKPAGSQNPYGCEDPRLVLIGQKIFMCYTAYNGFDSPRIAISHISKKDLAARRFIWSEPVIITPKSTDDKDGILLPKKFSRGYLVIHRVNHHITGDYVDDLLFTPSEVDTSFEILEPRRGMWDGKRVGLAGTPHLLKAGWLMFYHGIDEQDTYRVGAALLDKDDPTEILARSAAPLFEPLMPYEKEGEVPNVVFPCGSIIRGDKLYLYYGGADRVVGVATASLKEILAGLK